MIDFFTNHKVLFLYLLVLGAIFLSYKLTSDLDNEPGKNLFIVEGYVLNVQHADKSSTILLETNDGPLAVNFSKKITNINLLDHIQVRTDGLIAESIPPQTKGFSFKALNRSLIIRPSHTTFTFDNSLLTEKFNHLSFETVVFEEKDSLKSFLDENNIEINNLDQVFIDGKSAILSYTHGENGYINHSFIRNDNQFAIVFEKNQSKNKGFITILDSNLIEDFTIKTLTN